MMSRIQASFLCLLAMTVSTGCTAVGQHLMNFMDQHQELSKVRQETREELAEERQQALQDARERELRQLKYELERQRIESQLCAANQEAQRQLMQRQIRDKVESKVAFDVTQGLEVGELEVDVEELKRLLEQREKEVPTPPQLQQQQQQPKCGCEEECCGCKPGLKKKHCLRCKHLKCKKCEETCGGPEALQQALSQPQRALRPTEIPLKLPVRLTFGMQNPQVEQARIFQEALPQLQQQQQKQKCDDACDEGHCPLPLLDSAVNPDDLPPKPDISQTRYQVFPAPLFPEALDSAPRQRSWME